jgi:hypothetical protein
MDRTIVYPGAIPLDTDILSAQLDAMIGIGYLAQAMLGTSIIADGLVCTPTAPASLSVSVGPGSITASTVVDESAFGGLPAEPTQPLVKMGINLGATTLTLTPPTLSGQAITYLIEATMQESDNTPVLLPYYNAANPAMPFSGPGNDGQAQNTKRGQTVQLQLKAGAPGAIGTQRAPSVDTGWAGLYTVTVETGQTAITAANITTLASAPFLQWKLPMLTPGTSHLAVFTPATQGNWAIPAGITNLRVKIWGGGGAGGAGFGGGGGGGAGGGYSEGYFSVTPGAIVTVAVGTGGIGSGAAGGISSFGNLASATGGSAGANGGANQAGTGATNGGVGAGGALIIAGQDGATAFLVQNGWCSGAGGGSFGSPGANPSFGASSGNTPGQSGLLPGAGGSGGVGDGAGGEGGAGLIIIEW